MGSEHDRKQVNLLTSKTSQAADGTKRIADGESHRTDHTEVKTGLLLQRSLVYVNITGRTRGLTSLPCTYLNI